jgi:hypothetical protein
MEKRKNSFFVLVLFSLLAFVGCGKQQTVVTDFKVNPYFEEDDLYLSVSTQLNLGNISLPSLVLPIIHPKTYENLGNFVIQSTGLGSAVAINLNISEVAKIQGALAKLPNGNNLPLIGENQVIVIPIQNIARVYLSVGASTMALGFDITFSGLDGAGQTVGNVSLFPNFAVGPVIGSAGMFFSKTAGQNGIGLFADISAALDELVFVELGKNSQEANLKSLSWNSELQLNYSAVTPSKRIQDKIDKEIARLHRNKTTLRL